MSGRVFTNHHDGSPVTGEVGMPRARISQPEGHPRGRGVFQPGIRSRSQPQVLPYPGTIGMLPYLHGWRYYEGRPENSSPGLGNSRTVFPAPIAKALLNT